MTELALVERAHSRISPSSFARVEHCTASLRLSADAPYVASGPDALAGTAAHLLGEKCLRQGLDTFELSDVHSVMVQDGEAAVEVEVDDVMLDGVQVYLDAVRDATIGRKIEIEQQNSPRVR